jgi:CubicO group peptidase (beta-lactamase class C family)
MSAFATGACCAQVPVAVDVAARLDSVAKSYRSGDAFMGSVLVVEGDRVLLDKGYGLASVEWNIPDAPDVKFRLGSLTKQFTATLVLLLQQDGKLNIEDPVSKYLPDAPKAWEKITLKDLLGHTSGIPNFTDDKEFGEWRMNARTHEQLIAFFRNKPLVFEPGSKFSYSSSNFEVLGAVIEEVSGKSYEELLRTRIFEPLGMKNSGLDSDELVLTKRAQGYMLEKGKLQLARSESMTVPWAAGSIYSTTGDLLLWERGLFGGKVLNEASLKAMTTSGKGEYGLGVFVAQMKGLKTVLHGGGIEGFNTQLIYIPDRKLAIVVLANVNGSAAQEIADKLLTVVLGNR